MKEATPVKPGVSNLDSRIGAAAFGQSLGHGGSHPVAIYDRPRVQRLLSLTPGTDPVRLHGSQTPVALQAVVLQRSCMEPPSLNRNSWFPGKSLGALCYTPDL